MLESVVPNHTYAILAVRRGRVLAGRSSERCPGCRERLCPRAAIDGHVDAEGGYHCDGCGGSDCAVVAQSQLLCVRHRHPSG